MNYKDKFVGIKVYGYCDGFFGCYAYEDKTIIASGENWVVAKDDNDSVVFASFDTPSDMEASVEKWSVKEED